MSGEVDQYEVLSGEVIPARPILRDEAAVIRQGMVRQRKLQVLAYLQHLSLQYDGQLYAESREIVGNSIRQMLADQDGMTDPRERALMKQFDDPALKEHMTFQLGVRRTGMLHIEAIIREPFVPEERQPTFWQVFIGAA